MAQSVDMTAACVIQMSRFGDRDTSPFVSEDV